MIASEIRRPETLTKSRDGRIAIMNETLHRYPTLQPILKEMAILGELPHNLNVVTLSKDMAGVLLIENIINRKSFDRLDGTLSGAILHDIGKPGISPEGISTSLKLMYPEKTNGQGKIIRLSGDQTDLRSPMERAQQHLHPLVGGFIIEELIASGYLPGQAYRIWAKFAFNHHESLTDDHNGQNKTSYPRQNGRRPHTPTSTLATVIIQLSDIAAGMREERYSRTPLSYDLVATELESVLSEKVFLNLKPILPEGMTYKGFVPVFLQTALSASNKLDPFINQPLPLSQFNWRKNLSSASTPLVIARPMDLLNNDLNSLTPNLSHLIAMVWHKHGKRLEETLNHFRNNNFTHTSRKSNLPIAY